MTEPHPCGLIQLQTNFVATAFPKAPARASDSIAGALALGRGLGVTAMNRYITEGLFRDAAVGQRVLVFAAKIGAQEIFHEVSALAKDATGVTRVLRANGRECIEFVNGGRLRVISTSSSAGRGYEGDVVYVEGWSDLSESKREDIALTALCGELIRA